MGTDLILDPQVSRPRAAALCPRRRPRSRSRAPARLQIRSWVLLPIFVAMFLISMARHYATKLMQADAKVDTKALREAQAVIRSQRLRAGAQFLPASAFEGRKAYFCAPEVRSRLSACPASSPARQPYAPPPPAPCSPSRLLRRACSTRRWRR